MTLIDRAEGMPWSKQVQLITMRLGRPDNGRAIKKLAPSYPWT